MSLADRLQSAGCKTRQVHDWPSAGLVRSKTAIKTIEGEF